MKSAVRGFIVTLVIWIVFGGMAVAQITNIELVRKHHEEVWSKGNLVVADEIYSNEIVRHSADQPVMRGREPYKQFMLGLHVIPIDDKEVLYVTCSVFSCDNNYRVK